VSIISKIKFIPQADDRERHINRLLSDRHKLRAFTKTIDWDTAAPEVKQQFNVRRSAVDYGEDIHQQFNVRRSAVDYGEDTIDWDTKFYFVM
jgi:hypothetical protein